MTVEKVHTNLLWARKWLMLRRAAIVSGGLSDDDAVRFEKIRSFLPLAKQHLLAHQIDIAEDPNDALCALPQKNAHMRFQAGLEQCFNRDELKSIVFELQINAEDLPDTTIAVLVRELIGYCVRRSIVSSLLATVQRERPAYPWPVFADLQMALDQQYQHDAHTPLQNQRPDALSDTFGEGIRRLKEPFQAHSRTPQTQKIFLDMLRQFDEVDTYKTIHEQLHNLRPRCYEPLMAVLRGDTEDATKFVEIERYSANLDAFISDTKSKQKLEKYNHVLLSILEDSDECSKQLQLLTNKYDGKILREILEQIKRLISWNLTKINGFIIKSAADLPIDQFIILLQNTLTKLTLKQEDDYNYLDTDIESLKRYKNELIKLINDHNHWQKVNDQLQSAIEYTEWSDEVYIHWRLAEKDALLLYTSRNEPWAQMMQKAANQITAALAVSDLPKARSQLTEYRYWATQRFQRVDKYLLDHCKQLPRLESVIRYCIGQEG